MSLIISFFLLFTIVDVWSFKWPWFDVFGKKTLYMICEVIIFQRRHISKLSFFYNVHFSSVTRSCLTLCSLMDCSTPGLPVHHQFREFSQIHVHWVGDAIQPSHPLLSPSPPALNLPQYQGLFKWFNSLHQVAKVLELQLQYQSFPRIFRTDFL